jgi:filamentous hemagglutinin family protein
MNCSDRRFWGLSASLVFTLLLPGHAMAQIVPDTTLPNPSRVSDNCTQCEITGGTTVGNNLFHSFNRFSVPTGGSAYFNNADGIETIFSRVTGRSVSRIDGLIRANGTANLFLLNPNGVIFGENAALNIGGSFIATSGDRILFSDGSEFSATNPTAAPLLTVSVPIGLQFGSSPGRIENRSRVPRVDPTTGAIVDEASGGLQVLPGQTLALIGGSITFLGGRVAVERGRIELGSVGANQIVEIIEQESDWRFGYGSITTFQNIRFLQEAFVDASGNGGSDVQLQGRNIILTEGSQLNSTTLSSEPAGNVSLFATDTVEVSSSSAASLTSLAADVGLPEASEINAIATGNGGRLLIEANQLFVGNIATISASTYGVGNAGNLIVRVDRLVAENLGQILTSTFGAGDAGNLIINAADSVELIGGAFFGNEFFPSALLAQVEPTGNGNAGDLTINTRQLTVLGGAQINSVARNAGQGGSVTVNGSDSIRISGAAPNATATVGRSGIGVSAEPGALRNAGQLNITTPILLVENRGEIAANNRGGTGQGGLIRLNVGQLSVQSDSDIRASCIENCTGQAGNLQINSNSINLDRGRLTATTTGIGGANIQLQGISQLTLRNQSLISAEALNQADGGNVTIQADNGFAIATPNENNDILANADRGNGGQISITAQGILGLVVRDRLTDFSDINASSEAGLDGEIIINTPDVDPSQGLVALPANLLDASRQIAQVCGQEGAIAETPSDEFVLTGRGGLPQSPTAALLGEALASDLGTPPSSTAISSTLPDLSNVAAAPIEAQGWIRSPEGQITLVAHVPTALAALSLQCDRS